MKQALKPISLSLVLIIVIYILLKKNQSKGQSGKVNLLVEELADPKTPFEPKNYADAIYQDLKESINNLELYKIVLALSDSELNAVWLKWVQHYRAKAGLQLGQAIKAHNFSNAKIKVTAQQIVDRLNKLKLV